MDTRKKTRINTGSIVITFVEFLNVVKMYHWNTRSYSEHKATDELYEVLGKNIDKFVEIMLGNKRLPTLKTKITIINTNRVEFMAIVNKFKIFLLKLNMAPDLMNVRDDILADVDQFIYLLSQF
jgi:DNA-binding ferritin-like protein